MIISDCLLLRWPAIRPISIDGIHPSLFVREDYIKRNDLLSMTKIEMTWFAPLHIFHEKHQLKWIFIVVYLGVQRPCLLRCTWAWLCLALRRSIAILVPSTLLSRRCFLDIVLRAVLLRTWPDLLLTKFRCSVRIALEAATARECLQILSYLYLPQTQVAWSL